MSLEQELANMSVGKQILLGLSIFVLLPFFLVWSMLMCAERFWFWIGTFVGICTIIFGVPNGR